MKNGKMKIAPASVIRASEPCPAILKRIRKTSEFFRKLSLKALKNWHQNRGAKRLVVSRLEDINGSASWCRRLGRGLQAPGGATQTEGSYRFGHGSLSIPC